ncbi:hypothetical protein JW935_18170 [candidate division KSB1 bacterium]|nr:hypothetical protein [candidate division KSB1 bacterium]
MNWKSPNDQWKDMSCRVVLLRLHKKGILTLPNSRSKPSLGAQQKRSVGKIPVKPMPELECDLEKLYQ